MLRFEDQGSLVELDLAHVETDPLPSKGDAVVTIRVASAGFTGVNDAWVFADALREFCAALVRLERERRGEARLVSMSPNELDLTVRSIGSRGHMAVEGSTGHHMHLEDRTCWHAVHFGFDFDPSQLVAAAHVSWVKANTKD